VARALVVVGEPLALEADLDRTRLDHHAAGRRGAWRPPSLGRVDTGLGQLERLEHRLVVLVLVLEQHLADERPDLLQVGEHALPHGLQVRGRLVSFQIGHVDPLGAGRLGGVVEVGELGPQQLQPRLAAEPQVLERGDVPEVPDQRAHQRVVLAVEVLVGHGLDQAERSLARLLQQRLDPSEGHCSRAVDGATR
jgi:hypothetical protein